MRSDRLLSLLLLLQARGRDTAPRIGRELQVSVRTVYRDVAALSAAGVPVYTEQGNGGGIRLLPGYRTDVTGLTAAESRALVTLTGQALPDDLGLGAELASALRKLVAAGPASHREEADRARQRVLVDHTGWYRQAPPAPLLPSVQEAVWAERRLRVRYRHGDGRTADYLLDPYGLVLKAGVWYLVAAHRRQPRLFRVDRLTSVSTSEQASARPDDLDLATVWQRLRDQVQAPGNSIRVHLKVVPHAYPTLLRVTTGQRADPEPAPDPTQIPPPGPDGRIALELTFRAHAAACAVLAGFGASIEVIEPASLCEDLLDVARQILTLYRSAADR